MEVMQITREGSKVMFKSLLSPKYPARVMVASATTRASVPASVESNPPLYVPRESLDDMTLERSDKLTPAQMAVEDMLRMRQKLSVRLLLLKKLTIL